MKRAPTTYSLKSVLKFSLFLCLGICAILLGALILRPVPSTVYVDPVLKTAVSPQLSVIVMADSAETAAEAVKAAGGTITSDLWLINAVGATVAAEQLEVLAATPGIRSITENQSVRTAEIDPYAWEGWVTDRRTYIERHNLSTPLYAPLTALPDGGAFAVNEDGKMVIINEDGSERFRINLDGKPYRKPGVVSSSNIIYIAGETKAYAIRAATGEIIWQRNAPTKFSGGVALGSNHLYVADEKTKVYALNLSNGVIAWTAVDSTNFKFLAPPVVGVDGTPYIVNEKGILMAINPASGSTNWTFAASTSGSPYQHSPQLDANGNIYFFGYKGYVYRVSPGGSQNYFVTLNDNIWSDAVVSSDGIFYAGTENGSIIGLNGDGDLVLDKAAPNGGHVYTTPALSADESTLYVTMKEGKLLAYDVATGNRKWTHNTNDDLLSGPVVAPNGNLHVGDKSGAYEIIDAATGMIVYRYTGFTQFVNSPTLSKNGSAYFFDTPANSAVVVLSRIPEGWSESIPHVEPTDNANVYKVANPISIDMGADIAHENGITGDGVTVAVVDSGVYFDANTQATLGNAVQQNFLGQADFVGGSNCAATSPNGGCFTDFSNSQDGYGHGSHVAGIIWNNVKDYYTGATVGIAPDAQVLSIRVLGDDGVGTYEDVIEGIQYVVDNKDTFDIRVMNLSLSGWARSPYFADPLNRAVEEAWAAGIVVLAAAGNEGPYAESITVPGNDPYIITIGAVDSNKTPGYWADDRLANFSSTGPTLDGFVKPDLLVPGGNVVSYMFNDGDTDPATSHSPALVLAHPDYSVSSSMFRMNGTSMSTAVASGVVALILEAHPTMTPNQVKYRIMASTQTAMADNELLYSPLQQGIGRIWVPDAVFGDIPLLEANSGMDINADLAHGWLKLDDNGDPVIDDNGDYVLDEAELAFHYQGQVQKVISDDGQVYLYYTEDPTDGSLVVLGAADLQTLMWIEVGDLAGMDVTFDNANNGTEDWPHAEVWANGVYNWAGGVYNWAGGVYNWAGGVYNWAGGVYNWAGGVYNWAGGVYNWAGGVYNWAGGVYNWAGGVYNWAGGVYNWAGGVYNWAGSTGVSSTTWVGEDWVTRTPTITPTPMITPTPTATNTPVPTSTNTPVPTATNTAVPTATNTPSPTATNTPAPTATNTPTPTATNTPAPTATNTPTPTATNTAVPTATNTPVPTATNTAVPTATNTPSPTATNTPAPTATNTPTPTATNTPTPTATPTGGPTNDDQQSDNYTLFLPFIVK